MRKKNTYFQFKQFTVNQENAAMKVCTDSCLLGALADPGRSETILDIGTGTGLLALMLAQKSHFQSQITAVEIDEGAAREAKGNVLRSPWSDRIDVVNQAFQQFVSDRSKHSFDFIISNPPFFANNLQSGNTAKDLALHSTGLSLEELATGVSTLLKPDGRFVYLLPVYESGRLIDILQQYGLFPQYIFQVFEKPERNAIRQVVVCSKDKFQTEFTEVFIRDSEGNYSDQFKALLKDYYLIF